MAELVVKLPQAEYQTFLNKVAKLRKAGVDVPVSYTHLRAHETLR